MMGCDIHIIVERKFRDRWVGIHACGYVNHVSHSLYPHETSLLEGPNKWSAHWRCEGRDYDLFGHLAGVRGSGPEPNGIPDDVSDLAQMVIESWGDDGHSHCHYLLRDCAMHFIARNAPEVIVAEERYNWLASFFGLEDFTGKDDLLNNTRLIILFDN